MISTEIQEIRPRFQGMPLSHFLRDVEMEPDSAQVVFDWLPYSQISNPDGTTRYRPPSISLGLLREDFLLRLAFPHEAQTVIF